MAKKVPVAMELNSVQLNLLKKISHFMYIVYYTDLIIKIKKILHLNVW